MIRRLSTFLNRFLMKFSFSAKADFELHYRTIAWEANGPLGNDYGEWQLIPVYQPNGNHSLRLHELQCGAAYELFIRQPTHGWQSERLRFRTQGRAPIAPTKSNVLQTINGTVYVFPSVWLATASGQHALVAASRLSHPESMKKDGEEDDGDNDDEREEGPNAKETPAGRIVSIAEDLVAMSKNESDLTMLSSNGDKIDCPIRRLVVEYRNAGSGLWKLLFAQPISADSAPLPLPLLTEQSNSYVINIRMTAYTIGRPYTMAEYQLRTGEPNSGEVADEEASTATAEHRLDGGAVLSLLCSLLILLLGTLLFIYLLLLRRRQSLVRKEMIEYCGTSASGTGLIGSSNSSGNAPKMAPLNYSTTHLIEKRPPPPPPLSKPPLPPVPSFASVLANAANLASRSAGYGSCKKPTQATSTALTAVNKSGSSTMTLSTSGNNCARSQPSSIKPHPIDLYDEITPYATFTLSAEDNQPNDELPESVQQLHALHRQLSKLRETSTNAQAETTCQTRGVTGLIHTSTGQSQFKRNFTGSRLGLNLANNTS